MNKEVTKQSTMPLYTPEQLATIEIMFHNDWMNRLRKLKNVKHAVHVSKVTVEDNKRKTKNVIQVRFTKSNGDLVNRTFDVAEGVNNLTNRDYEYLINNVRTA